ncbi:MAG TPA: serine/threonine-protein kinase [Candidatus Polarisedimenticolaceae bacterium]|nr:serine/threonine-protein kinase [Candidatus Polarisedimenticolaceae bacterium]
MPERDRLSELAVRVADREAIDWALERARPSSGDELRLVEELASIDRLVAAIRAAEAAPDDALTGLTLGPYRLEAAVDRGGMGDVYRAFDESRDIAVAVKVLHPAIAARPDERRRFLREARIARRVDHPSVAVALEVLEHDGQILIVMEWIDGEPLSALLARGPVPPDRAAALVRSIAEALAAVHRARIIHRDVKPGNVMLTPGGAIKLMDFGVALQTMTSEKMEESLDRLTREGRSVGTIRYMAPEQLRGEAVDERADLFALGIVAWEMFTGVHPFLRATSYAIAAATLDDPPGSASRWPREAGALKPVVLRLLEKDPARRTPSADALIVDLDRAGSRRRTLLDRLLRRRP